MALLLKKGNWFIDYYAYGKRKRIKIGPSKALAENVLRKLRVEIAENKYLDIKKEQKIKFEDFADEYLELHSKPNNRSWFKSDRHNLNNLKAHFSGKYLHEITPLLIEKYKVERSREVSPATVNRNLACLKSMFNRAIEWDKAQENPVRKVKLFRENNKRLRYLEREEIVKLLANCKRNLKSIVIVALNTGMRKGEILGLKWHDVDFKRGIIYLLNTKNSEKREIPMNEQVKTALIRTRKHARSPYIFCKPDGKPYGDIKKSFFTAMKKSDIINFRFHDLRHTFASQLVMSGIDLNTVRELLGHKSLEMTLRYSHLSPDHKKRAVDILARRLDTFWTPAANVETRSKELVNTTL
ncbi:MAG: tyrosine-type recombinase/integrase [Nitrospirota bacterium]